MFWIAWLAAASLFSLIGSLTAYILVARYGLVQRIAAAVLQRGLRGISAQDHRSQKFDYTVTQTRTGKHFHK